MEKGNFGKGDKVLCNGVGAFGIKGWSEGITFPDPDCFIEGGRELIVLECIEAQIPHTTKLLRFEGVEGVFNANDFAKIS